MNFFGVYGYKIRDLGVDGFINSFKCKKVLKSNLFRTIEGLKNFIIYCMNVFQLVTMSRTLLGTRSRDFRVMVLCGSQNSAV